MNTQDNIRTESHKDPAQLEREIDQKRGHIEQLVSALENRLSPGEIFERMVRNGGGKEFASNLADTVKANPVPALLTAAGLLWLYSGRNNPPSRASSYGTAGASAYGASDYGTASSYGASSEFETGESQSSGMRDRIHAARDKVGSARVRVSEGTRNAASSVRERASTAGQSVRHGARRANDGMQRLLNENPMAAAGIGIAVGALLGALVPPTRKEDELLGQHSDRLTGKAKEFARTGADSIKGMSREVMSSQGQGGGSSQEASSASTAPATPTATSGGASASTGASSAAASRPH